MIMDTFSRVGAGEDTVIGSKCNVSIMECGNVYEILPCIDRGINADIVKIWYHRSLEVSVL